MEENSNFLKKIPIIKPHSFRPKFIFISCDSPSSSKKFSYKCFSSYHFFISYEKKRKSSSICYLKFFFSLKVRIKHQLKAVLAVPTVKLWIQIQKISAVPIRRVLQKKKGIWWKNEVWENQTKKNLLNKLRVENAPANDRHFFFWSIWYFMAVRLRHNFFILFCFRLEYFYIIMFMTRFYWLFMMLPLWIIYFRFFLFIFSNSFQYWPIS